MKNKGIQKILKKMKTEEAEKIIAYIEKLEKEFLEEEKQSSRLFVINQDLIAEREKVIEHIKVAIDAFSTMHKHEKDEEKKLRLEGKIMIYENILKKYKK